MDKKNKLAFTRINYILMIVGMFTIVLGFFIMTLDREPHGFGFLGITLGPIIVIAGFIIEFFAIMAKPKSTDK
jgi:hypothetical protein